MSVEFITNDMQGITQQVDNLNQTVESDKTKNEKLLEQQNKVKDIIEKEKTDIESKINKYDSYTDTGIRDALLKKNGSQRWKEYNKMFFILIFAVAVLIGLELVEQHFPFVPEWILTILRILTIAFGIIWLFAINDRINSRDVLNYDKLNLAKPNVDTPEEIEKKRKAAEKEGDLLGSINVEKCKGPHNCGDGTMWDSEKMLCVPVTNENFDNISPNQPNILHKKL
jgi:hypothetical protein